MKRGDEMIVNKQVDFNKINEEKREVEVIVRVPGIADYDGDISTVEDIEEMASSYLHWRHVDAHHSFDTIGNVSQSYILKQNRIETLPNGRNSETPAGSWIAVLKVLDDKVWKQVKDGTITGASLVAIPGKIMKENGEIESVRTKQEEIDEVFKEASNPEKTTKIDIILSEKSSEMNTEGAGGGTTLDYLKSLGFGLEVICISLVELPNQAEAQLLSVKNIKGFKEYLEEFKNDFLKLINKEKIVSKEVEIMNREDLIKLMLEDEEVKNILLSLVTPVIEDKVEEVEVIEKEVKEDEIVEKEVEEIDELEVLKAEIEKLKAENVLLSSKSRELKTDTKVENKQTYVRKRNNGIGKL
jgi:hypothetical protein